MAELQKHKGAVRVFGILMRVMARIQGLPARMTPTPFRLLEIGSAFWQSRALFVAARLDIASILGGETLAADEIAGRVAVDGEALYRLLRMLAAMGIFEQTPQGGFRNNKVSEHLRRDHPRTIRPMILMHNSEAMSRPWFEELESGVRKGEPPFRLAHGEELFEYLEHHPEQDALFSEAMESVEALTGDSYATDFDWGRFERVLDIGGSRGTKALTLLEHHEHLQALVVDRPRVVEEAGDHWQGKKDPAVLTRLGFQAGDVLGTLPAARNDRDIYFLSAVLHGFDDATCIGALRNLAEASGDSGAPIAVMEMVMEPGRPDYLATSFDLQMSVNTRGRERTLWEWRSLFEKSGLELREIIHLRPFGRILLLFPCSPF